MLIGGRGSPSMPCDRLIDAGNKGCDGLAGGLDLIPRWRDPMLSVLRIMVGLLFLEHGMAKWLGFPSSPALDHMSPLSPSGLAGFLELFGGILFTFGLFTRTTGFVLSGLMRSEERRVGKECRL